ncbi:MAG: diacylglycerol kinase family protein [Bacteroidia bacterium]
MGESWKIIANPTAGGGKWFAKKIKIESHLRNEQLDFTWHFPKSIAEVHRLLDSLLREGNLNFISAGGDGTLHHIVNAIMHQDLVATEEIKLGILPLGTGNDWIKTHKIPSSLKRAVAIIAAGQTRLQDIGWVQYQNEGNQEERYFCNVAGTGFEATVVLKSLTMSKGGLKGLFLYLALVLRTLFRYVSQMHAVNDREAKPMLMATIGICRFNGGGMKLVPDADPFDGLFDLTTIGDLSHGEVIGNLAKLYNGRIYKHSKVTFERVKVCHIDGPEPIPIEADGEYLGLSPAKFEILPARVRFIVP